VEIEELTPNLSVLRDGAWQCYLWREGGRSMLVDTGAPGLGDRIRDAVGSVDTVVLTHFHADHTGSAAHVREWSGATVVAGAGDAAIIRGEVAGPPPVLEDWERPLFERVTTGLPWTVPPVRVDREVSDGDELDNGAQVLALPGHTEGSIALYLPQHRVLFTGDTAAHFEGRVMLGTFNLDRERTAAGLRKLAALDVEVACFGHGEPIVEAAGERLRAAGV